MRDGAGADGGGADDEGAVCDGVGESGERLGVAEDVRGGDRRVGCFELCGFEGGGVVVDETEVVKPKSCMARAAAPMFCGLRAPTRMMVKRARAAVESMGSILWVCLPR